MIGLDGGLLVKVLLINPGGLPVPDVKGGAVQNLITNLIKQNEKFKAVELYSITPFDDEAFRESKKYKCTEFIFFAIPNIINRVDKVLYFCASKISSHPQSFGRIFKSFFYIKELKKNLLENDYDKIVFEHNNILLLVLKDKKVYQKYKNKYILHLHNDIRTVKPIIPLINDCPEIWTVSEYLKKSVVKDSRFCIDPQRVRVFYNAIDGSVFKKIPFKNNNGKFINYLDPKKQKILFAGRLNKEKGIEETLEVFSKLDHSKYQLLVVGDVFYSVNTSDRCAYFEKYNRLIEKHDIVLTGYVDNIDMPILYNMADIVILPSMWNEPAGLTMLEAVFCEKKLITTNSGGIPEYVKDCSIIVDRENVVDGILDVIQTIECVNFDYNKIREKFSIENYYSRFVKFLGEGGV